MQPISATKDTLSNPVARAEDLNFFARDSQSHLARRVDHLTPCQHADGRPSHSQPSEQTNGSNPNPTLWACAAASLNSVLGHVLWGTDPRRQRLVRTGSAPTESSDGCIGETASRRSARHRQSSDGAAPPAESCPAPLPASGKLPSFRPMCRPTKIWNFARSWARFCP